MHGAQRETSIRRGGAPPPLIALLVIQMQGISSTASQAEARKKSTVDSR